MSFPGAILMGAQRRLLPVSIPYRFFLAAAVFHALMWVLLALAADSLAGYGGGPGPLLAVLHALTLGVLVSTAMGASFQMLPVATGNDLFALWPARAASWLLFPGIPLLLQGFHGGDPALMTAGGTAVTGALLLFALVVGDLLRRTGGMLLVLRLHGWGALAALGLVAALGMAVIADYGRGFLPDRAGVGLAHLILATYGFMGFLALGYSQILVPMFALSPAPDEKRARLGFGLALGGLLLAVAGALGGLRPPIGIGAALGLAAAGLYVGAMIRSIRGGMRKNLGLSFSVIKLSWAMLPLALLAGGAAALGYGGGRMVRLFVFLTLFGWLLTFLLGILQRIIPFLAGMNAGKGAGGRTARLSELADERPLAFHAGCHGLALVLVAGGIASGAGGLVLAGALAGLAGALAFLWFAVDVFRQLLKTHKNNSKMET